MLVKTEVKVNNIQSILKQYTKNCAQFLCSHSICIWGFSSKFFLMDLNICEEDYRRSPRDSIDST
jgi:hypothetical protein